MTRSTILASLLLLAACSKDAGDDADGAPTPVALVTLGTVEEAPVRATVTLYGAAEAGTTGSLVLAAPADANVARIVAPVGTRVSRGDVVVELAPAPTTHVDLAKAAADARAADAAYARARRLRGDGLVGDAEVESARAAAQGADAARATLAGQTGGLVLRAPAGGYVGSIAAAPGTRVQAGDAVATIARLDDLRAHLGADPAVARTLRPGAAMRIDPGPGGAPFAATIQAVDPVVDPQTRLAAVYARLPSRAGIAIGQTLTATVASSTGGDALTIPYAALLDDGGQPYVYVAAAGIAHRRDVTTGPASGDRIAIEKGLRTNDLVVVSGGTALEDGMKVRTK